MINITSIFGTIALVTSFIGLLPQSYKAFKTKSTSDLSMIMLLNYVLCSFAWIIYGIYTQTGFVISSNIIGFVSAVLLILQKRYYDIQNLQNLQQR